MRTRGITNLLDEYHSCIERKDYVEANEKCKKISGLFLENAEAQPNEVMSYVEKNWVGNNFTKMMPLLLVAADLYKRSSNVRGMCSCIKSVLRTMDLMDGKEENMKQLWLKHQVHFMHKIKDDIGRSLSVAFIDKSEAMITALNYIKDGEKCADARWAARKTALSAKYWRWKLTRRKKYPNGLLICCASLCLFAFVGLIITVVVVATR